MDKNWIDLDDRLSNEYCHGVAKFLKFAFLGKEDGSRICCPCKKCRNRFNKTREDVMYHCMRNGFDPTYKNWTCHGEMYVPFHTKKDAGQSNVGDDMTGMLYDVMGIPQRDANIESDQQSDLNELSGADVETTKFLKLLQDAETELFPGCKKPEPERTKEFKDKVFTNAMGDDNRSRMKCTGRTRKRATTQVFSSLQKDKEELQKLKDGLTREREKMQQVKEEFIHEKELLLLEKEKTNLLIKKLEAMLNQFPAMSSVIPHSPQVPESSSLNRTTIDQSRDTPSFEEEQIDVGRSKKQKNSLQDYIKSL